LEYVYVNKRNSEIDEMSKPDNLVKAMPHYKEKLELIAQFRKATDDAAKSGVYGQRLAGYVGDPKTSGLKVIARIPEALLTVLLEVEPDLVNDSSTWHKWLKKHPEFRAYSPGSKL
jgi:hypothetical protein